MNKIKKRANIEFFDFIQFLLQVVDFLLDLLLRSDGRIWQVYRCNRCSGRAGAFRICDSRVLWRRFVLFLFHFDGTPTDGVLRATTLLPTNFSLQFIKGLVYSARRHFSAYLHFALKFWLFILGNVAKIVKLSIVFVLFFAPWIWVILAGTRTFPSPH